MLQVRPLPFIGMGLMALGVATGVTTPALIGCNDGFTSENGNPDAGAAGGIGGTGGTTTGTGGTGGAGGAGGDGGMGLGGAAPDRPGYNGDYYKCNDGSSGYCSIVDIDMNESNLCLLTGYSGNNLGCGPINLNDPLETISVTFGSTLGAQAQVPDQGWGFIHPVQRTELSYGHTLAPFEVFNTEVVDENDLSMTSALALIDPNGVTQSWLLQKFQYVQVEPVLIIDMDKIPGGVSKDVDGQNTVFVATSSKDTGTGYVLPYRIKQDGWLDEKDLSLPVRTSGQYLSSIADLGTNEIAVLNTEGPNGAAIDFIDTQAPDPGDALTSSVSLGSGIRAVSLFEMALTDDKNYAVIAGGTGSSLTTLYIVDMVSKQKVGEIDLAQQAPVNAIKDVEVMDMKAYVSTRNDNGIDNVVIVDFSAPSSPAVEMTTDAGYGLGEIAVFKSGMDVYFYVAAQAGWWEPAPAETDPVARIIAGKPSEIEETDGGT